MNFSLDSLVNLVLFHQIIHEQHQQSESTILQVYLSQAPVLDLVPKQAFNSFLDYHFSKTAKEFSKFLPCLW